MPITLTPYLSFGGNTREAFAFYEKALGAKIETMMSYAEMPRSAAGDGGCGDGPPPSGEGIMHACLVLPGGAMLFAGDTPPGMPYEGVKGVMLALQYDTIDQAHGAFHALSQGGQVTMPLAPAFWAKTFGMLTDRFGVSWAVNGEPIAFSFKEKNATHRPHLTSQPDCHAAGNSPKPGDFSHDYVNRERTEKRTACHAHTTGRVAAGVGGRPRAVAREGKGPDPRP